MTQASPKPSGKPRGSGKSPAGSAEKSSARKPAAKPAAASKATKATAKPAAALGASASERQIVFDPSLDRSELAAQAISDSVILAALVENLALEQRRVRQFSAATLNVISEMEPQLLVDFVEQIIDALYRPEAQTRWECLEVLSNVVPIAPELCDSAIAGTETSLYDEESGVARLAAMRFVCIYGALDVTRADKVWPLIDEAIQCYHGDPEFQDMLISVSGFASGNIGAAVKKKLGARMDFDAKNARGQLKRRAEFIVGLCKKK